MNAGIYLVKDTDQLVRMDEQPYDSEDLLQELLEKYPYYNPAPSRTDDKDLDCGGRAQRRHRFPHCRLLPKAAWRFASRRSPKSVVAAIAALGSSVFIRD
jgi:hypothetical protein